MKHEMEMVLPSVSGGDERADVEAGVLSIHSIEMCFESSGHFSPPGDEGASPMIRRVIGVDHSRLRVWIAHEDREHEEGESYELSLRGRGIRKFRFGVHEGSSFREFKAKGVNHGFVFESTKK